MKAKTWMGIGATLLWGAVLVLGILQPPNPFYVPEPVQAASPAATSMCEPIGVVGNVIISRCIDEDTGIILYVNSAGFMLLGE